MDPEKILALVRELRKDAADATKLDALTDAISDLVKRLKEDADEEGDDDFVKVKKADFEALKEKADSFDEIEKEKADTKRGDSAIALSVISERRRLDALARAFGVDERTIDEATTSALRLAIARRVDSKIDEKADPAYLDGIIATAAKVRADSLSGVDDGGLGGLRFDSDAGRGARADTADDLDLMGEQIKGYRPSA